MSLIKSLIQRLLDSRTTPEEAGHSAMPSPNEVSLTPSVTTKEVWGDVCTGTASSDGYIRMSFSATSPEAIGSARSFGAVVFSTPQLKGDIVSVVCPVAKGKAYAMSVRNANNITCAFVKLIGAIGGGYNHIVWRALSCLRPSFNYLSRSFSRVNGKQSKLGIFQKSETRLHSHQRQGKTLFTRLQRTDTFKSSCETARRVKNSPSLCTQEETKTAVQGRNSKILMDGFLYIYPFSRVKLSRFSAQELSQTLSLRSIRTTNLQTGGALC